MLKKLKTLAAGGLLALIFSYSYPGFSQTNPDGCFPDICLGSFLEDLNFDWENKSSIIKFETTRIMIRVNQRKAFSGLTESDFEQLINYGYSGDKKWDLDNNSLEIFLKARAYCDDFIVIGEFTSKGGLKTEVTFSPMIVGASTKLVVSKISRTFKGLFRDTPELEQLVKQIRTKFQLFDEEGDQLISIIERRYGEDEFIIRVFSPNFFGGRKTFGSNDPLYRKRPPGLPRFKIPLLSSFSGCQPKKIKDFELQ